MRWNVNVLLLALCTTLLAGCFIPRDFTIEITAQEKALSIEYDGELIAYDVFKGRNSGTDKDRMALMEMLSSGFAEHVRKSFRGTYSAKLHDNGVMDVEWSGAKPYLEFRRDSQASGTISVRHQGEGVFLIESVQYKSSNRDAFLKAGLDLDELAGDVCFKVTKGVTVLEHNADSKPGLFSGCYKWHLDMGKGEVMRIVIKVDAIEEILKAEEARKQRERKEALRAEQAKRQRLIEVHATALQEYCQTVLESRAKAAEVWANVIVESRESAIWSEKSIYGYSDNVYSTLSFSVSNTNDFPVTIQKYKLDIRDKKGNMLREIDIYSKGQAAIPPAGSTSFTRKEWLNHGSNYQELGPTLMSEGVTFSIYPEAIRPRLEGAYGDIEPNGDPFLPSQPRLPRGLASLLNSEKERQAMLEVEKVLAERGHKPLPPTDKETFSEPGEWHSFVREGQGTAAAQQPAPARAPKPTTPAAKAPSVEPETQEPAPAPAQAPTPAPAPPANDQAAASEPESREQAASQEPFTDPVTGIEFVWVPRGCFLMGSPPEEKDREESEGPLHKMCVQGFWMSKYEVTNEQFRKFNPGHVSRKEGFGNLDSPHQPVVMVTWTDADGFTRWMTEQSGGNASYRLPTEIEWEYAARAGTRTARYWGEDPNQACEYANVGDKSKRSEWFFNSIASSTHDCDDQFAETAPVGRFKPNAFGLHDMLGNAWEWCQNWHDDNAYTKHVQEVEESEKGSEMKSMRGGSWDYGPDAVRAATRGVASPQERLANTGVRIVREK